MIAIIKFGHLHTSVSVFQIPVGTQQLLRQMAAYIEKKHYHISKKVGEVGFAWHPDTLFQISYVSVGPSLSCQKYCLAWSFLKT